MVGVSLNSPQRWPLAVRLEVERGREQKSKPRPAAASCDWFGGILMHSPTRVLIHRQKSHPAQQGPCLA